MLNPVKSDSTSDATTCRLIGGFGAQRRREGVVRTFGGAWLATGVDSRRRLLPR